jgi:hypothetical protein
LIAAIVVALPFVVLMIQIDLLPPFTLGNAPIIWTIGGIMVFGILVQVVYAIFLPRMITTKVGNTIGRIIAGTMLVYIPVGTFFGLLLLDELRNATSKENVSKEQSWTTEITKKTLVENTSTYILLSGLISLLFAGLILWIHLFVMTQQIDLAYPIMTTTKIQAIEWFGRIYFLVFCIQIAVGYWFTEHAEKIWMQILVILIGLFQIFAISIIIQYFVTNTIPILELDAELRNSAILIGKFAWIPAILLRPLGLYFGIGIIKQILQIRRIKS